MNRDNQLWYKREFKDEKQNMKIITSVVDT